MIHLGISFYYVQKIVPSDLFFLMSFFVVVFLSFLPEIIIYAWVSSIKGRSAREGIISGNFSAFGLNKYDNNYAEK